MLSHLELVDPSQEAVISGEDETTGKLPRNRLLSLREVRLQCRAFLLEILLELLEQAHHELDLSQRFVRFTLEDLLGGNVLARL